MDSNTHSPQGSTGPAGPPAAGAPPQSPDWLARLAADVKGLDAEDLDRLSDTAVANQTLQLQQLADCLDGIVLRHLAAVDARGAAGAERGVQFGSTASHVRTARALFRGPLSESGTALCAGEISAAHAKVLAASTLHLPDQVIS